MPYAVVTGSNRGIGLALVKVLLADGYEVLAACRKTSSELSSTSATVVEGVDVLEQAGVNKLKDAVGSREIDLLICNAAVGLIDGIDDDNIADEMKRHFNVNVVGPVLTIKAVKANFKSGTHVALITSLAGSVQMMKPAAEGPGFLSYCTSKAALNMAGNRISGPLAAKGVSMLTLHPGVVDTDMMTGTLGTMIPGVKAGDDSPFGKVITPEESAKAMVVLMKKAKAEDGFKFMSYDGNVLPW